MTESEFCDKFIGVAWVNRGESECGCDCWGLVMASFREVEGVELPQIAGYANPDCPTTEAAKGAEDMECYQECRPKNGAIAAVFDRKGRIEHVGRILCGRVLHATSALGVRHDTIRSFTRIYPTARYYEYATNFPQA